MKFNPITNNLFTDDGRLIKQLHCPKNMNWDQLKKEEVNLKKRLCSACNHPVLDTQFYSEENLTKLLEKDPRTCLKIDLDQNNIEIIIHEAI